MSQNGRPITTLGAGNYFGEIALLHHVPRAPTVRAVTPATLLALDRVEFLQVVTDHPMSRKAAEATVQRRLDEDEQS